MLKCIFFFQIIIVCVIKMHICTSVIAETELFHLILSEDGTPEGGERGNTQQLQTQFNLTAVFHPD